MMRALASALWAACLIALATSKSLSSESEAEYDYNDYWEKWQQEHGGHWWDDHEMGMAEAEMGMPEMGMAEAEMDMAMTEAEAEMEMDMAMAEAEAEMDMSEEGLYYDETTDDKMMDDEHWKVADTDEDNDLEKREDDLDGKDYPTFDSSRAEGGDEDYDSASTSEMEPDATRDVISNPEENESERVFQPVAMPTDFASYDVSPKDGRVSIEELVRVTAARENVEAVFEVSDLNHDGFIDKDEFYEAPLRLDGNLQDAVDGLALLRSDIASLGSDVSLPKNEGAGDTSSDDTANRKVDDGMESSKLGD